MSEKKVKQAADPLKRVATQRGFYNERLRERGDRFTLKRPEDHSSKWMATLEEWENILAEEEHQAAVNAGIEEAENEQ